MYFESFIEKEFIFLLLTWNFTNNVFSSCRNIKLIRHKNIFKISFWKKKKFIKLRLLIFFKSIFMKLAIIFLERSNLLICWTSALQFMLKFKVVKFIWKFKTTSLGYFRNFLYFTSSPRNKKFQQFVAKINFFHVFPWLEFYFWN